MPKRNSQKARKKSDASLKGKLVEMIVAGMHKTPNVRVESNVRLPALRNPQRKREIDILVSGSFVGYPVQIAIECKNYESIIDVSYIDAYIGKLQDVGIPTQHGIYVTVGEYTSGALERAKEVGVTPLILTGLTPDRLAANIYDAVQSIIYLLLDIAQLKISCDVDITENAFQLWSIYDKEDRLQGMIPDFIAMSWVKGLLPADIGRHEIKLEIPEGAQLKVDGKYKNLMEVVVEYEIKGLVLSIPGAATHHTLINPTNKRMDKFQSGATFDMSPRTYPLSTFSAEEELVTFLDQRPETVKLSLGRFRLPRIRCESLYWPLSSRALIALNQLTTRCLAKGRTATRQELDSIEGSDLKAMWDALWPDNPILGDENPW